MKPIITSPHSWGKKQRIRDKDIDKKTAGGLIAAEGNVVERYDHLRTDAKPQFRLSQIEAGLIVLKHDLSTRQEKSGQQTLSRQINLAIARLNALGSLRVVIWVILLRMQAPQAD